MSQRHHQLASQARGSSGRLCRAGGTQQWKIVGLGGATGEHHLACLRADQRSDLNSRSGHSLCGGVLVLAGSGPGGVYRAASEGARSVRRLRHAGGPGGGAHRFVKAADALDLSTAVVSRTVQDLETALGVRLLQRTTRRVSLTPEGESVLQSARGLLDLP
jgi:hypothetical protein